MKAIEVTGTVDEQGNLSLDEPVPEIADSRVRIIILYAEIVEETDHNPDDTPIEDIKASLRRSLEQAKAGQRLPLSQLWDGIDK